MFKTIAAAAAAVFVLAGAPAIGQPASSPLTAPVGLADPCFDGCMLNCLKQGDYHTCSEICFEVACPSVQAPEVTRVQGL